VPPFSEGETAYFTAFSMSGCSSRLGTIAESAVSSMAYSSFRRSPKRSFSVVKYRFIASISCLSVTFFIGSWSSVYRRNSDNRMTVWFAVRFSLSRIRVEIAFSVLKRKCGLSW
jgi:hypothetical protein